MNQFGFLAKHSSCSQLFSVLNQWFSVFDANESVDIIYTDIAKAFDSVCHFKLISVLLCYGIKGKLLSWIKCFLSGHFLYVCINNEFLSSLPVNSGVPQGSILSPLLFVVYINDMVNAVSSCNPSSSYLYADECDDTKIFCNDSVKLQFVLDKFAA